MQTTESLNSTSLSTAKVETPNPRMNFETLDGCPLCFGISVRKLPVPRRLIGKEVFSSGRGELGLRRCQECSLVFVSPRPGPALLDAFYSCESYSCHSPAAGSASTAKFLLECVARHGPYRGERFLDFGCGGGFLLRAALNDHWKAFGHDVGQRALASCKAQGLIATSNLEELAPPDFDVIFLNHVFEHVADPEAVLSHCRRLLNKRGKLFIVVPNLSGLRARLSFPLLSRHCNIDERYRAFPIHLFYYSPRTLSQTLQKHGFNVTAVETFGLGMDEFISRGYVGSNEGSKKSRVKKNRLSRQIIKKALFSARLGENLLVVAQRA